MKTRADKTQENTVSDHRRKSQSVAKGKSQMKNGGESSYQFVDNRPEAAAQRKLQEMANNSPQISQLKSFHGVFNNSPELNQTDQSRAIWSNSSQVIQRATDMNEEDWSKEKANYFMMNKQTRDGLKNKKAADLSGQNKANASIWYNTLFSDGLNEEDPDYDPEQEKVLQDQQAMLKKHFLAQAVMGVQGGKQYKKGKEEDYQPIENFKQEGTSANLATLASGGGRFNYRSTDGSGDEFNKFLMGTEDLDSARSSDSSQGGMQPTSHMGAYKRIGTHDESFKDGHITEVDKTTGGIDSTGFDIPIGGIGQKLNDAKGRTVTTGYQGVSEAIRRKGANQKKYQTGHGFHRHAAREDGKHSQTQIAFEGSGPNMDNIHGGSHGKIATVKKKVFKKASAKTLTGQDKRAELELPKEVGGIKADVTAEKTTNLKNAYSVLESLKNSANPEHNQLEKRYYQRLLTSETAVERKTIVDELLNLQDHGA